MANFEFETFPDVFYKIRSSPEVRKVLEQMAEAIAKQANESADLEDGYRTSSVQGAKDPQGRWRTTVITATAEAMADNAKNNTLIRSADAGRR